MIVVKYLIWNHTVPEMQQSFDLNFVPIFLKVVDLCSFSGAAKALGMQKSTVSRAVAALEEHIGAQLFFRTSRKVVPTVAGHSLYANCRASYHSLEEGILATSRQSQRLEGTIRLTALEDVGTSWLAPMLGKFAEAYPKISFDLVFTTEPLDLVGESIDVAVRVGKLTQSSHRVRKIGTVSFILAASPAYLARFANELVVEDLKTVDFISYSSFRVQDKGVELVNNGERQKLRIKPKFQTTSTLVAHELALLGQGVAMLPDFLCAESFRTLRLRPVCKGWSFSRKAVSVVTPSSAQRSHAVNLFTEFLANQMREKLF
jgi:DNA-binding transcriptional LysR family regulator